MEREAGGGSGSNAQVCGKMKRDPRGAVVFTKKQNATRVMAHQDGKIGTGRGRQRPQASKANPNKLRLFTSGAKAIRVGGSKGSDFQRVGHPEGEA